MSSTACVCRPFELAAPNRAGPFCFLTKISSVKPRRPVCGPLFYFWTPLGRSCCWSMRALTSVLRTKMFPLARIPFRPLDSAVNAWSLTVLYTSQPFWAPAIVLFAAEFQRSKPKRGFFLPAREHVSSGAPFSAAPEKGGGCRFQEPLDCRVESRVQLLSPGSCNHTVRSRPAPLQYTSVARTTADRAESKGSTR